MPDKIAFAASHADVAQTARAALVTRYGNVEMDQADVIVVGQDFVTAGVRVAATYQQADQ